MNGVDLARENRRRRPGLPVLLTRGYAGTALASACEDKFDVLAKPYEISELETALRAARK